MKIERCDITVKDLVKDYSEKGDDGVTGYGGKLDIRPPFQREFIYGAKEQVAVINSIIKSYPLNVMYWTVREDKTYEVLDGQQRTISIARYIQNRFHIKHEDRPKFYDNLDDEIKKHILNYPLTIYVCEGTRDEKKEWFEIINIAGKQLSEQELRNAIYHGPWVSDAKRYFSKKNCVASAIGSPYIPAKFKRDRQEYLETAIKWITGGQGQAIDEYMAAHEKKPDAEELWDYFQSVIKWIEDTFTEYHSEMKKVPDWGNLYNTYKDATLDPIAIKTRVAELRGDHEVKNKPGIYAYILTGEEKHLNLRTFDAPMKTTVYERQGGRCALCKKPFKMEDMHADHIDPWSKGGKTNEQNCQMLCRKCNQTKSAK